MRVYRIFHRLRGRLLRALIDAPPFAHARASARKTRINQHQRAETSLRIGRASDRDGLADAGLNSVDMDIVAT